MKTLDRALPAHGRSRDVFTAVVFTWPWSRWYRFVYIPENRDLFFEYILSFFYEYSIAPGHVVVQIGASFGEETARFAKAVGRHGRVIAIEPDAANLARLRATFTEENFPQVTVIAKAAWNQTAELPFLYGGEREHRLADIPAKSLTYEFWGVSEDLAENRYAGSRLVAADTVDNIVRPFALDRIDFILVETNGSELEVVEGMQEVLPITRRLGVRAHVMRDGVAIDRAVSLKLQAMGFVTKVTSEGMVLAARAPAGGSAATQRSGIGGRA